MKRRVSIKDIAQQVGCSMAAVSKVLNDSRGSTAVGAELRERIQRAANELGYQPNYSAQVLRAQRATGIGAVVRTTASETRLTGGFSTMLISGVEMEARAQGMALTLIGETSGPESGETALRYLAQGRVNVLVGAPAESLDFVERLDAQDGPIVWAAAKGVRRHPNVMLDQEPGLVASLEHLMTLGHRRLLLLGDLPEERHPESLLFQRLEFIRHWWSSHGGQVEAPGLATVLVDPDDDWWKHRLELGRQTILHALRQPGPAPTAVFALTETIAQGILYGLLEAGKRVPDDISLLGFGNIRAQLFLPPLTCVSQELRRIGQRAVQLALQRWDGTEFPPGHIERIPSAFVERESTGPARRS